jgi:FemAB-related protein (PEP-CTERM system-associated)
VTVEIRSGAGLSSEAWDSQVRRGAGWSHFHLSGWKDVIERVFGHECPYVVAVADGGEVHGVLPLVRLRSRLFGHYLVSMPFVNYGGPLGSAAAVRRLTDHAVDLARASRVDVLEFRSRVPLDLDLEVSHRKITVVLDLPQGDAAGLWKALPSKVRSQVRRPQKEGVTVAFGPDQLDPFYHVFARHMRDLGTPVQSRQLFRSILATFPDDVWFGCAYVNGRPIAGGCGFVWGNEFEITWASALREFSAIAPNMMLYWSFIERCVERGLGSFNFGRCTPGGGTHKFKRQWGGRDEPLWWYQWRAGRRSGTPSAGEGAFSWGPRIWSHLPVTVANRLGPRIVRSIP